MPRISRIVLAALVSLGVIIGIYTSVEGASLGAGQDKIGSHYVSSSAINMNYYRSAAPNLIQMQDGQQERGNGCHSDHMQTDPDG